MGEKTRAQDNRSRAIGETKREGSSKREREREKNVEEIEPSEGEGKHTRQNRPAWPRTHTNMKRSVIREGEKERKTISLRVERLYTWGEGCDGGVIHLAVHLETDGPGAGWQWLMGPARL